jgi:hypothetical protein
MSKVGGRAHHRSQTPCHRCSVTVGLDALQRADNSVCDISCCLGNVTDLVEGELACRELDGNAIPSSNGGELGSVVSAGAHIQGSHGGAMR